MAWYDYLKPVGWGNPIIKGKNSRNFFKDMVTGTPEEHERVSTLLPGQQPLLDQAVNAGLKPGAGGAFGDVADYYRSNLSNNPEDMQAFAAPQMRQFNEEIIPGLSEQFAGMGAGALSSSGFRNAAVNAGTDLSERLGSIRAQLRQSSAQGLQGIGQVGLGNYSQDVVTKQGSGGLISQAAPIVGAATGFAMGGPPGAAAGYQAGNMFQNSFGGNKVGNNTHPYASSQTRASPQLPNFQYNQRGY